MKSKWKNPKLTILKVYFFVGIWGLWFACVISIIK